MNHNFFIHSTVEGHLGGLHVLTIVNSAVMKNGIHFYFSILVFSRYMPRRGIARSYGGFILVFKGISTASSIVAISIYILTKSARTFPFLQHLLFVDFLMIAILTGVR